MFRFRVVGRVREAGSERPLRDLLVRAYDKDLLRDDHLGDAKTDETGSFEIEFTELAFRELGEQRPDVYLRIFDPSGRTELHSTASAVRHQARVQEHFEIRVPAEKLAAVQLSR
jgi:carotenoid cleavage dioxygenase